MHVADTTIGAHLWISPHVRACQSDGQIIFLDLRRNRYIGIAGQRLNVLEEIVEGWPKMSEALKGRATSGDVARLTERLLLQGLLTRDPPKRHPDATLEEPSSSLDLYRASATTVVGARRVGRFVQSAAASAFWLRFRSLDSIARAIAARREKLARSAQSPHSFDEVLNLATTYETLRPFLFTAQDRCLHDSLALLGFMAAEGVLGRWVIGVKTRPFAAHSWVQSGATVLNDQHEHARKFRPILVV